MGVVDTQHSAAQFQVTAGDGLFFIEFHRSPVDRCVQRDSVAHSQGWPRKRKAKLARNDEKIVPLALQSPDEWPPPFEK
jgi:hypothetical protein